jgi:S-DNA-T family DNA segregation ATPase FtsK/SpoIIIE
MAEQRLITVSQLRCACLDPEWRRRWIRGESPPTLSFAPSAAAPVHGRLFHQLAFRFAEALASAPAPGSETGEELWGMLYDQFAREPLEELIARGQLPSAHHLAKALRSFCDRLASLRKSAPEFRNWQDLFVTQEFRIDRVPFHFGSDEILVSGRPDAVRTDRETGLQIVDYKLSRGGSLKQDLLQLAIYSRLLQLVRPGLRFAGALEYYEPELHLVSASAAELDDLFREIVEPVLSVLSSGKHPQKSASSATALSATGDDFQTVARKIERCYADFKLTVTVLRCEEAPQLVRYRVLPASGVKVVSLANRAEDLQVALALPQPPLVRAAPGCVTIDLPKPQPDTVSWETVIKSPALPEGPLVFPVGVGIQGALLTADLGDPNTCHGLVAGASGSGKSEFLKAFVASLVYRNGPGKLRLTLIDPKSVTFAGLAGTPHIDGGVQTQVSGITDALEAAADEMERRYRDLADAGFESIQQRGISAEMPLRVIVIDEFADLVMQGRSERERFERFVTRLAQKGRAAGIHLVLATQRPDSKVISGSIKSNLPLRICLRVTSAVNSQIVLGEAGAEALLGRGDLLCDRGRGLERAQSPMVTREQFATLSGTHR